MSFTHLHVKSHYSLLGALPKIDDLVKKAKGFEMEALALTDNGNLYGAIEFYKECLKKEIKPIIGVDFYLAPRSRLSKDGALDKPRDRIVFLAKDELGYKNLIKLVTISHLEGFYYRPRIDKEIIEKYKEGLVCICPMLSGDIQKVLLEKNEDLALEKLDFYKKTFGDDFYLGISIQNELEGFSKKLDTVLDFAQRTKSKVVACPEVYYLEKDDRPAWKTLLSVQSSGENRDDTGAYMFFKNKELVEKEFKDVEKALMHNEEIVKKCNLVLTLGKWAFPDFKIDSGISPDDELKRITYLGLDKKKIAKNSEVLDRIEYELSVIKKKGYSQYFLVVADLLLYARENGILATTRGSAAGSMVSYLTSITTVNPIDYKLPFERFLNPDRPSAPDIDMDFADNRRDEMVEYAKKRYGLNKVAQIGTFGTMAARGAVRDTARALGFPYSLGDMISKLIPIGSQGFPMTIDRAIEETAELKTLYKDDKDTKTIIDMAKKIEGCARHMGIHAAGVVISPTEITDYTPLQYDPKGEGKVITQYDMHSVGEDGAGLLKFDFLGIKNLSILADSVGRVKKIENIDLDIENIPLDDQKTFKMLARGETEGLFQLNGDGMTRFLVELKPTSIHDINAMVALYRPGPMESIPEYIKRKHNPNLIKYLDPRMKEYLGMSYGLLVYQDDVMLTAINLANYSWIEADKLRKAMGKKIPEVMATEKEKLIKGLISGSMSEEKANKIWTLIEPFAAYGFNKAHAASYGKVAYQTAYMKANFPAIYMSAVLTADSGETERIAEIIEECKKIGISVLPPDINESFSDFTVVKNAEKPTIRFGLTTIKNFGEGISHSITEERKKNGKFLSIENFLKRIKDKNLNKKSLEALIKSGSFNSFCKTEDLRWRGTLLHNLDRLLSFAKESKDDLTQNSIFGQDSGSRLDLQEISNYNKANELLWEKELLGLYISGHPLDQFESRLLKTGQNISRIKKEGKEKSDVVLGAVVENIKEIATKKGDKMVFVLLSDKTGSIEAVAFPKIFEEFKDILNKDSCVVIKGKISMRNDEKSILIDKVKILE